MLSAVREVIVPVCEPIWTAMNRADHLAETVNMLVMGSLPTHSRAVTQNERSVSRITVLGSGRDGIESHALGGTEIPERGTTEESGQKVGG